MNVPDNVEELPVNEALSLAAVPLKEPVAVAVLTVVATVVSLPFVGSVPALNEPLVQEITRLSSASVPGLNVNVGNVQEGKVPTLVIELTVVVFISTVGVTETLPAGV